jgi:hypothetical protein
MPGVVGDAREPLDHHRDPRQGPEICRKPMRTRALAECPIDPLELRLVQFRLTPSAPRPTQPRGSTASPFAIPATYALPAHPQGTGDLGHDLAGRKQARRPTAAQFQGMEVSAWCYMGIHAPIINVGAGSVTLFCETH